MTEPINQVCNSCGMAANVLTCIVKYQKIPVKIAFDVSTFHSGECDVCGRITSVTEPRDYFHPDFSLLGAKFKKRLREELTNEPNI